MRFNSQSGSCRQNVSRGQFGHAISCVETMTHSQHCPNRTELCLDWIERLFWLVPVAMITLVAAAGALVAYLVSGLIAGSCGRLFRFRSHHDSKTDQEREKPVRAEMAAEAASLSNRRHSESPLGDPLLMSKRSRDRGFSRMGFSGCLPAQNHKCASNLSVPRYPGAPVRSQRRF